MATRIDPPGGGSLEFAAYLVPTNGFVGSAFSNTGVSAPDVPSVRVAGTVLGWALSPATMPIIDYQRGDHAILRRLAVKLVPYHSLRYPEFVDYYFTGSPSCQLKILVDQDERPQGVLGLERMNFATPEGELQLGIGTNFAAFERAAGGLLFMQLIKSSDLGMMFGGSHDSHRIARGLHWTYFSSVRRFHLNRGYEFPLGEVWWKRLARTALRLRLPVNVAETARRVLCDGSLPLVEVAEESRFTEDLLPQTPPFSLRFNPGVEYLNWRYNTELPFVRYRLFRILASGKTAGYVVINQRPQRMVVAQCDGEDPLLLTAGIFAAMMAMFWAKGSPAKGSPANRSPAKGSPASRSPANRLPAKRFRGEVFLTSAHRVMQQAFRQAGFREDREAHPFFLGRTTGKTNVPQDTGDWLINFDWGDNGLRAPFLGSPSL